MKAARNKESYAGKCKLEGDTLIIKGLSYTVADLEKLPQDLSCTKVTSKSTDDIIAFFGELNPLSNFHDCSFTHDGISFHSSEQFIQYHKALYFKDRQVADTIISADTALKCKSLAKKLVNYDHTKWKEDASKVCTPGICAKFHQNPCLMHYLQSTGRKTIVEATFDNI